MRCGCPCAEDCALTNWCPVLGGRRENAGWRAACPVCHAPRALEYDAARGVRWNVFCPCDRDAVRKALVRLLGDHAGGRGRHAPPAPGTLTAVALAPMGGTALRAVLLVMDGMGTEEALDRLGVGRTSRYRVRREMSVVRITGAALYPPASRRDDGSTACQDKKRGP